MASYTPASGVWSEDYYDEFGNVVRRNQDARQVRHMYNMPGRLPPPPPALSPRGSFVPEARYPYFPGQAPPPPPASSPRGTFVPEAHRPHFPPGPDFTPSARPPAGFPPLGNWPDIRYPPFTPSNVKSPAAAPQTPPPTLLSSTKKGEEARHWTQKRDANGEKYYMNTLTKEWQLETPDCLKKYTTR